MSEFFLPILTLAHNFSGTALPIEKCEQLGLLNLSLSQLTQQLNITCLDHAPTLNTVTLRKAIFLVAIAIVTIVFNGWMMIHIQEKQRHRSSHLYTLISHLALADIIVAAFCMFGEGFWLYTAEWVLGNVGCKIFKFSQMFSLYLSTFIMVLIAIDHFISIRYPLKLLSRGNCVRLVGFCWIASTALSAPQAIIFHLEKGPFQEPFFQCVTHNFYTADWQEQVYTALSGFFMFVVPLMVLVYTHLMIFWTLHRTEKFRNPAVSVALVDSRRQKIMRGAKMKSLRNSLTITIMFLTCWTPYYVLMILSIFIHGTANEELKEKIFFFGMPTSLFNPLIYGLFHVYRPKRKQLGCATSRKKAPVTKFSVPAVRSSSVHHKREFNAVNVHSGARFLA